MKINNEIKAISTVISLLCSRVAGSNNSRARVLATAILSLSLVACATPYRYPPGSDTVRFSLGQDDALMDDGYRLPLSIWPSAQTGSCRAVLLALHGLNDYRNAFVGLGPYLAERGVTVYAYDQRGFGDARGAGYWHGWQRMTQDLRAMTALLRSAHPDCPLYLLGESMGGGIVLAAQREAPLDVDGAILVAPAVWPRDAMPWYQRAALWVAVHTVPGKRLTGEGLELHPSDNIEMLRALGRDPKVIKATRIDVLYGITNLMDAAASVSTTQLGNSLLLYGMHDEIIPRQPTCQFLGRLEQAPDSPRVRLYPQGYHMLTRDLNARVVLEDITSWLLSSGKVASDGEVIDGFCNGGWQ